MLPNYLDFVNRQAEASGVTEYDTWADLPSSPEDGARALVLDAQIGAVALDGVWLPGPLVGGDTLTRDTNASFGLTDALADLTGRGWAGAGATKAAGQPLVLNGQWDAAYLEFLRDYDSVLVRLDYEVVAGEGWAFLATLGPTKRVDHFYGADSVERVNSSGSTVDGPYSTTGPVFIRLTSTQMAWWCPGAEEVGVAVFNQVAPSALDAYTNALYSGLIAVYGAYSGSATWRVNRLDVWEVT